MDNVDKKVEELEKRIIEIEKKDMVRDQNINGLVEDSAYRRRQVKEIFDDIAILKDDRTETRITLKNIESKIDKLEGKVDEVLSKPAKRWEGAVNTGVATIVGGIIGGALAFIIK